MTSDADDVIRPRQHCDLTCGPLQKALPPIQRMPLSRESSDYALRQVHGEGFATHAPTIIQIPEWKTVFMHHGDDIVIKRARLSQQQEVKQ
eukprot:6481314-Amphidinium_carterae.2